MCPDIAAAKFPSQVSPSDLAVVVYTDGVGMQTVTVCVVNPRRACAARVTVVVLCVSE